MLIREATSNDLGAIISFDVFDGDRGAEVRRGECFVALEGERVAGYIVFNHTFYLKPFIQFLCVHPDFRRRGLANGLLEYIEGICDGERLFISTESDNLPMLRLLNRREYRVSGVIDNIQAQAEIVFCKEFRR